MAEEIAIGVFPDQAQAEAAIALLEAHEFSADTLSMVMAGSGSAPSEGEGGGTAAGATVGGVLGGLGGLLLSAGLIAIPGIGPVLAAGPLLATLGGAAVGAGAGGLIGTLTGAGLSEAQAKGMEQYIRQGAVMVAVSPTERHEEARALLKQAGASETDFSLAGDEPPPAVPVPEGAGS